MGLLGLYHYQLLTSVLESIHYIYDDEMLANTILANISKALDAEGGSIFKVHQDNTIFPLSAYGASIEELRKMKFAVGRGVVGWVAQYSQPVKVDRPSQDQRFMGAIDTATGFKTRSILAAPILAKGNTIGVIEFLNKRSGPFAAADLELISMVGREVGIAFENAALIKSLEKANDFQEAILNSLAAGVLVIDLDGNLLKANPQAKDILRIVYEPIDGKPSPISTVLAAFYSLFTVLKELNTTGGVAKRQEMHVFIQGQDRVIGYSGVPIKDKDNQRIGLVFLFQDITDLR